MKTSEIQYPVWKSALWRGLRAGLAGGAGAVTLQVITLNADLSNVEVYFRALLAAFIAGAISSIGLLVRDSFGSKDRSEGVVNKLPL